MLFCCVWNICNRFENLLFMITTRNLSANGRVNSVRISSVFFPQRVDFIEWKIASESFFFISYINRVSNRQYFPLNICGRNRYYVAVYSFSPFSRKHLNERSKSLSNHFGCEHQCFVIELSIHNMSIFSLSSMPDIHGSLLANSFFFLRLFAKIIQILRHNMRRLTSN